MGWRDINMSRRKPPLRLAAVPREEGQDHASAVLRKAAGAAIAALAQQPATAPDAFTAGYLAGYARHQALKHGLDAEAEVPPLEALLAELSLLAPQGLASSLRALTFSPRAGADARASLSATQPQADAGYLVGHLESLCGTCRLLSLAPPANCGPEAFAAYLTHCDHAADRLQTHQPTASLRFDAGERAVLRAAFAGNH
jgi:hypothetical protein